MAITCPECGMQIDGNIKDCPNCGCPIEVNNQPMNLLCQRCGYSLEPHYRVCPRCGEPVNNASSNDVNSMQYFGNQQKQNIQQQPNYGVSPQQYQGYPQQYYGQLNPNYQQQPNGFGGQQQFQGFQQPYTGQPYSSSQQQPNTAGVHQQEQMYQQQPQISRSRDNKINLFLSQKGEYFPSEKIQEIKDCLNKMEYENVDVVTAFEYKKPIILLVVSIFLGSLGIDRFLLDDTTNGILKLLTGGGCGIWWLIDIFLISSKTRNYNYNKFSSISGVNVPV